MRIPRLASFNAGTLGKVPFLSLASNEMPVHPHAQLDLPWTLKEVNDSIIIYRYRDTQNPASALNKLEKVALRLSRRRGRPLVLIVNNACTTGRIHSQSFTDANVDPFFSKC